MNSASFWIEHLSLLPHPEGGFYKETYQAADLIKSSSEDFPNGRSYGTAIYYLLEQGDFSAFHKIKSDEIWHFYQGGALQVFYFDTLGNLIEISLGPDAKAGQVFQAVVPANTWFASRPLVTSKYSLVGCTVAPGFDFRDFELADHNSLISEFPIYSDLILALSRE